MSTMKDYSAEEWKAISAAPVAAGLLITLSDASGPVGVAKEAMAVGKAITGSAVSDAPEIVRALVESVKSGSGKPELPDVPTGDRAKTKDALIGTIKTAVRAIETKSPAEGQPVQDLARVCRHEGVRGVEGRRLSRYRRNAGQR